MTVKNKRNEMLGKTVVKALKQRNFDAYYAEDSKSAIDIALSLIPKGDVVSWGGSMTIRDMGLVSAVKDAGYSVLDRDTAPPEDDIARKALTCDTYIMSTNALTENGELVNIDGNGNRVAALIFGPKSVIVVAGVNKIVRTVEDAYSRVKYKAAPINAQRFDIKTPCKVTGVCNNCKCEDSICANTVITRLSRPAKRVKVIIVGEELGF